MFLYPDVLGFKITHFHAVIVIPSNWLLGHGNDISSAAIISPNCRSSLVVNQ